MGWYEETHKILLGKYIYKPIYMFADLYKFCMFYKKSLKAANLSGWIDVQRTVVQNLF